MSENAVTKAIELCGLQPLAAACGVTYQAVRKWEAGRVPAERVLSIETATAGRVTREELRPDLYAVPNKEPPGSPPREGASAPASDSARGLVGRAAEETEGEAA